MNTTEHCDHCGRNCEYEPTEYNGWSLCDTCVPIIEQKVKEWEVEA